jgi:hypothetical protein
MKHILTRVILPLLGLATIVLIIVSGGSNAPHAQASPIAIIHNAAGGFVAGGTVSAPTVGEVLTSTNGTWTNNPIPPYTYAWDDCNSGGASCSAISGATASTYTIGSGDVGHTIASFVTATNGSGSTQQESNLSGVVTSGGSSTDFTAYTTGYGWPDNTPPGGAISNPVIHSTAGGTGTYADPITLAVGHSITGSVDTLDIPAGTIFYIPNVRRYFIVEDTCGDGSTPQTGPCHVGFPSDTTVWVDMWVGGQSGNTTAVDNCESFLTDSNGDAHLIIENPASNYIVVPGPLFGTNGTCSAVYGNTVTVGP